MAHLLLDNMTDDVLQMILAHAQDARRAQLAQVAASDRLIAQLKIRLTRVTSENSGSRGKTYAATHGSDEPHQTALVTTPKA